MDTREIIKSTSVTFGITEKEAEIFFRNDIALMGVVFPDGTGSAGSGKRVPKWFMKKYGIVLDVDNDFWIFNADGAGEVIKEIRDMEMVYRINNYIRTLNTQRMRENYYRRSHNGY